MMSLLRPIFILFVIFSINHSILYTCNGQQTNEPSSSTTESSSEYSGTSSTSSQSGGPSTSEGSSQGGDQTTEDVDPSNDSEPDKELTFLDYIKMIMGPNSTIQFPFYSPVLNVYRQRPLRTKRSLSAIPNDTIPDWHTKPGVLTATVLMKRIGKYHSLGPEYRAQLGNCPTEIANMATKACTPATCDFEVYRKCLAIVLSFDGSKYISPQTGAFVDNDNHHNRRIRSVQRYHHTPDISQVDEKVRSCGSFPEKIDINDLESCKSIIRGDVNSVYLLSHNTMHYREQPSGDLSTSSGLLLVSRNPPSICDSTHSWSDVKLIQTVTYPSDTYIYDIEKMENGSECSLLYCGLCLYQVPMSLDGDCKVSWTYGHGYNLRLCNTDSVKIGYLTRPVHGSEISLTSSIKDSSLYNYVSQKWAGTHYISKNYRPTEYGSIEPRTCISLQLTTDDPNVFQYTKCGKTIDYHQEYLDPMKRCNLKYSGYSYPTLMVHICRNWSKYKLLANAIMVYILIYILQLLGLFKAIMPAFTWTLSPVTFWVYKNWPSRFRCLRCHTPWSPWHKCDKYCVCGSKLDDNHSCDPIYFDKIIELENELNEAKKLDPDRALVLSTQLDYRKSIAYQKADPNMKSIRQQFKTPSNRYSRWVASMVMYCIIFFITVSFMPVAIADQACGTSDECMISHSLGRPVSTSSNPCYCKLLVTCEPSVHSLSDPGYVRVVSEGSSGSYKTFDTTFPNMTCPLGILESDLKRLYFGFLIETSPCYKTLSNNSIYSNTSSADIATLLDDSEQTWLEKYSNLAILCDVFEKIILNPENLKKPNVVALESDTIPSWPNVDRIPDQSVGMDSGKVVAKPSLVGETKFEREEKGYRDMIPQLKKILDSMSYNGSIFGRDHSIVYPDPPPTFEHVYTTTGKDQISSMEIKIPVRAGSIAVYKPIHKGKTVPLTLTVSIPEVATVYDLKFLYKSCKTSSIDIYRYDKCVGSCNDCFSLLEKSQSSLSSFEIQNMEKISYDNINTWGCEGDGCWTVNTGCLCGYCRNTPDPGQCVSVYRSSYLKSTALFCVGINSERSCEPVNLGSVVNKEELQMAFLGQDSSLQSVEEVIAIDERLGTVYNGPINDLGETSEKFGQPQYSDNNTLLSKTQDLDHSYTCHHQADQTLNVRSCYMDTWNQKDTLSKSNSFFYSSKRMLLYKTGMLYGTGDFIISVPEKVLSWDLGELKATISTVNCTGCYSCLQGSFCKLTIDSNINSLAEVSSSNGYVDSNTISLLRGKHDYRVKVTFNNRQQSSTFSILSGGKPIASKAVRMSLKEGNDPRTSVRNATARVVFTATSTKIPALSYFSSAIDNLSFGSSLVHYLIYIIIDITLIIVVALFVYFILRYFSKSVVNRMMKETYEKKSI